MRKVKYVRNIRLSGMTKAEYLQNLKLSGMAEAENPQNLRLALQEAYRILLHIDNFFWVISSFWITGTGIAIFKAFEWNGKDGNIIILGLIMIGAWILYWFYMKSILNQSKKYLYSANYYEKQLGIDVLPPEGIKGGIMFKKVMECVAIASILLMVGFIIQFIIYQYCGQCCHCCGCLCH